MDHTPDPAAAPDGGRSHEERHHDVEVRVRRSPRYGVFMAIGALLGAVIAWIVSVSMPPGVSETGQRLDTTPVIGLVVVMGFVLGAALGAVAALIADRVLSKRAHTATAEQLDVTETDASASVAPPPHVVEAEFEHHATVDPQAGPSAEADAAGDPHALGRSTEADAAGDPHAHGPTTEADENGDPSPEEHDRPRGA